LNRSPGGTAFIQRAVMSKEQKCAGLEKYPIVGVFPFDTDDGAQVTRGQPALEEGLLYLDEVKKLLYRLLPVEPANVIAAAINRLLPPLGKPCQICAITRGVRIEVVDLTSLDGEYDDLARTGHSSRVESV
jgi:hypothetical protein